MVFKVIETHYETRKEQMNMTYIDYINYFWRMDEALGFSPVEAKLFLKLLDIANKLNWKEDNLMIPMKKLMVAMDCSKNTVLKARKRLSDCGMIAVKPGYKNKKSACYQIICDYTNQEKKDSECDHTDNQDGETDHKKSEEQSPDRETGTLKDFAEKKEQTFHPSIRPDKDKDKNRKMMLNDHTDGGLTAEKIVQLFHSLCPTLKKVKKISKYTQEKITERANYFKTLKDWERYFAKAADSDFLCGRNNYGWQADFNWLIKDAQTPQKVLSGCYDTKKKTQKGTYFENSQGYDIVRGIYHKQTYFTNDNHLVPALAG